MVKYCKQTIKNIFLTVRLFFLQIFYVSKLKSNNGQIPIDINNYHITFIDNFSEDSINGQNKKWKIAPSWGRYHPDNIIKHNTAPPAYCADECIHIKNNLLYCELDRKDTIINYNDNTYIIPYIASYVDTEKIFSQQYGYFEIECKIPKGNGYWPAFWLCGDKTWPPEIDVFEFWSSENYQMKSGTYVKKNGKIIGSGTFFKLVCGKSKLPKSITDTFNKYSVWWTENFVRYYFNGILVYELILNMDLLDQPMYMIIDVMPDVSKSGKLDDSKLPIAMEVKSVTVYSK